MDPITGVLIGASVISGLFGASSSKKAARAQAAAAEAAARKAAETQKTLAGGQKKFDAGIIQSRYDTGLETLNIEAQGQNDGLGIERQAAANLRSQTTASYNLQRGYLASAGMAALQDEAATTTERVALSVASAMRDFEIRQNTVQQIMGGRIQAAKLAAGETFASAEDVKSDVARKADQEMASLRVASAERGAASTNSYLRLANETSYYKGIDVGRIDRKAQAQVDNLENDLVIAAVQAEADLQTSRGALLDTVTNGEQSIRETNRSISMKATELQTQIEQLTMQQMFDMESFDLNDEAMQIQADQLRAKYDLAKKTLGEELALSKKQSEFVFDQTVIASDAQMDSNIALAMANKNSAISLANTSFIQGLFSTATSLGSTQLQANISARANGTTPFSLFGL